MKGILWAVLTQELKCPDPKHPNHPEGSSLHHVTLQFNVERGDWEHLIGREFSAKVFYRAADEKADALFVSLPDWVPCQNSHPHLTISWAEGAGPVDSNNIHQKSVSPEGAIQWSGKQIPMQIEFKEFG